MTSTATTRRTSRAACRPRPGCSLTCSRHDPQVTCADVDHLAAGLRRRAGRPHLRPPGGDGPRAEGRQQHHRRPQDTDDLPLYPPLATAIARCFVARSRVTRARRAAAAARPRPAAAGARPDGPRLRAAARRRGAGPRRAHVGGPPQPRVQAGVRRVAVRLSDDPADRAGDGAAAPRATSASPRSASPSGCSVAGHLQHPVHRAGRHAAERLPARRRPTATPGCRPAWSSRSTETGQESRSAGRPSRT